MRYDNIKGSTREVEMASSNGDSNTTTHKRTKRHKEGPQNNKEGQERSEGQTQGSTQDTGDATKGPRKQHANQPALGTARG